MRKLYTETSDLNKFIFLFLIHGVSFDILWKKETNESHQMNYISGGLNLTPPPHISRIIQCKTWRSVIFVIYIIPYYLYDARTQYTESEYDVTKKKMQLFLAHQSRRLRVSL